MESITFEMGKAGDEDTMVADSPHLEDRMEGWKLMMTISQWCLLNERKKDRDEDESDQEEEDLAEEDNDEEEDLDKDESDQEEDLDEEDSDDGWV
nr:hypothetical protein [Tanacetum cinerariifolium]